MSVNTIFRCRLEAWLFRKERGLLPEQPGPSLFVGVLLRSLRTTELSASRLQGECEEGFPKWSP